jgi:excisionase family DNA binding protein
MVVFSFLSNYAVWMAVAERTVLPEAAYTYTQLHDVLTESVVYLETDEGSRVRLTDELLRVLADIVDVLQHGDAVSVVPRRTILTTQEAADMLGISRPTLVAMLERGEIPYEKPSRHRRVLLRDLLDYEAALRRRRSDALREMAEQSAERLDDEPVGPVRTR